MKAAIYARFSTEHQNPVSIDDQIDVCLKHCENNNFTVNPEHIFKDAATSGTLFDRDEFNRLLETARRKEFDVVVVDDLSRFSRTVLHTLLTYTELKYLNIPLIAVADNINSDKEESKLQILFKSIVNELDVDDMRKRTLRGLKGQKNRGFFLAEKTLGFKSVEVGPWRTDKRGILRPAGHNMIIHEDQKAVVERIFQEFAKYKSKNRIARQLNIEEIPNLNGKTGKWSVATIDRILRNEKYIGVWKWGVKQIKRKPMSGKIRQELREEGPLFVSIHEDLRIIDQDLWDKVQARLKEVRKVWPGRGRTGFTNQDGSRVQLYPEELFSGNMTCSECGHAIGKASGKGSGYYGCLGVRRGICKVNIIVPKKVLEKAIISAVIEKINNTENLEFILHKVEDMVSKITSTVSEEISKKTHILEKQKGRIHNLVEFIAEGKAKKSPSVAHELEVSEQIVEELLSELRALEQASSLTYTPVPVEWIQDRVEHLQEVLVKQPEQSAMFLRKLLGPIKLEPVYPDIGKPYFIARCVLQPLELFVGKKKKAQKDSCHEESFWAETYNGSNSFQWWAPLVINVRND